MKKNKITLKEFFYSYSAEDLAIHCDTEEKANKLLEAFDKFGQKWCNRERYIDDNYWKIEKENTCYDNTNEYSPFDYYKAHDYTIYEFEDVIFEEN